MMNKTVFYVCDAVASKCQYALKTDKNAQNIMEKYGTFFSG